MASRYFLTFCLLALFAAVVIAASVEDVAEDDAGFDLEDVSLDDDDIETRKSFGKKVLKILKKFFKGASERCLKEAAKKCKKHWYNPSKVIQCAKDFISPANAQCVVGA